ncbi:MAG: hypothetical protein ABI351_03910 [Herbaspirillum sp.]
MNPAKQIVSTSLALIMGFSAALISGCAPSPLGPEPTIGARTEGIVSMPSSPILSGIDAYKVELAQHISQANVNQISTGQPQALLRSVVVIRSLIDANGRLMRSTILRSNRDRKTEAIALNSLRKSAPFPKPASHLLHRGQVDIVETWLFNDDGHFQLRSIAAAQREE